MPSGKFYLLSSRSFAITWLKISLIIDCWLYILVHAYKHFREKESFKKCTDEKNINRREGVGRRRAGGEPEVKGAVTSFPHSTSLMSCFKPGAHPAAYHSSYSSLPYVSTIAIQTRRVPCMDLLDIPDFNVFVAYK